MPCVSYRPARLRGGGGYVGPFGPEQDHIRPTGSSTYSAGLPEPARAALFGWSRSRFFGPAPTPTLTHRTVNILFLRDPKYDYDDYDYDY